MRVAIFVLMAAMSGLIAGYFLLGESGETNRMDDASAAQIRGLETDLAEQSRDLAELRRRLDEQGRAREVAQAETARALSQLADAQRALAAAKAAKPLEETGPSAEELAQKREVLRKKVASSIALLQSDPTAFSIDPTRMQSLLAELKSLGREGTEQVLGLFESESSRDRIVAAQLLMQMVDPASMGPLGDAVINDPDPQVAAWASQALIRLDGDDAVPTLNKALSESPYESVRVNALWGLCRQGDEAGLSRTLDYYRDEEKSEAMRDALGRGLLALDTPKAMPIADEIARRKIGNASVMREVVDYYGKIPGSTATQRLVAISQNLDVPQTVRNRAIEILDAR